MKNSKLIDFKGNIARGTILRCKGKYPYEDYIDFIIVESRVFLTAESNVINTDSFRSFDTSTCTHALLVISGHKAGLIYTAFPAESRPEEKNGYAIDSEWLRLNWSKWGYTDCPLAEVYVILKTSPSNYFN